MSKRGDREFISDIKEAIKRINAYKDNMDYKEFLGDIKTQDAVIRNLEIIGEAAKNISETLKKKYPQVPWKDMARFRDKVIHFYFGVNYDIVWNVAINELPKVFREIKKILKAESD
jgi:uncharacterized protein with HEPN domain